MGIGEFILTVFVSAAGGFFLGLVADGKAEKYVRENILRGEKRDG